MENDYDPIWIFGWDNISQYLGKTARTAQRYARQGMPVFRDPGGRPMARKDQIDKYIVELNKEIKDGEPGVKEALEMIYEEEREAKDFRERLIHAQRRPRSIY
jgi:phage terminase Nu1 subunit (DNA packaging protein)